MIALEQVVPVVPQGIFSVMTLKVPVALLQKSWSKHKNLDLDYVIKILGPYKKVQGSYLNKAVFTVSTKDVSFLIKGSVMTISIDAACPTALVCGTYPSSILTSTIKKKNNVSAL